MLHLDILHHLDVSVLLSVHSKHFVQHGKYLLTCTVPQLFKYIYFGLEHTIINTEENLVNQDLASLHRG